MGPQVRSSGQVRSGWCDFVIRGGVWCSAKPWEADQARSVMTMRWWTNTSMYSSVSLSEWPRKTRNEGAPKSYCVPQCAPSIVTCHTVLYITPMYAWLHVWYTSIGRPKNFNLSYMMYTHNAPRSAFGCDYDMLAVTRSDLMPLAMTAFNHTLHACTEGVTSHCEPWYLWMSNSPQRAHDSRSSLADPA